MSTVALLLPVLLGFVAMGVDWGAVAVAHTQSRAAADAAALVAAWHFDEPERARALAAEYAAEVRVNNASSRMDAGDLVWGVWDGTVFSPTPWDEADALMVTARTHVDLPFTALFGLDDLDAVAVAGASPSAVVGRAPDTVLVLDVTASMSASELAATRDASVALLDCVHDRSSADSRASVLTFTGVDNPIVGMSSYGEHFDDLRDRVEGLRGCGNPGAPPCSGTHHAAGMGGALAILQRAETPADVGQAVVLLSDGEPNPNPICVSANYSGTPWRPELADLCAGLGQTCGRSGCTQNQPDLADYTDWADGYRAAAEAAGVDIYTVYYGTEALGIRFLAEHVRAGDGQALDTPSAASIGDLFHDICVATVRGTPGLIF